MTARRVFPAAAAAVVAGLLVAGGLALVRVPSGPTETAERFQPAARRSTGGVGLTEMPVGEAAGALRAEIVLHDPTPLFLPTPWNSGRVPASKTMERSPGTSFEPIAAKWVFPDQNNRLILPEVVGVPDNAIGVVTRLSPPIQLAELARTDDRGERLPARQGRWEVRSLGSGRRLAAGDLPAAAVPNGLRAPLELVLAVDVHGLIGNPTVVGAADGATVDFGEVTRMMQALSLGARLRPGIYRILLGP